MTPKFTVSKRGKITVIDFPEPIDLNQPLKCLLQFDEHWDNPHSSQELIQEHMQLAVDGGWPIVKGGDSFCAMQGRYDPRRSRKGVRPEHDHPNYIDRIVNGYADFCKFAAPNIAFMGRGNHELSVLKNIETDLIERTCEQLRQAGSNVQTGGIGGWLLFTMRKTKTQRLSLPVAYHHGHGGGGPVTRGVIQTNRRAVQYPDAAVVITGHVHEEWSVTVSRDRINGKTGRVYQDEQLHICSPTYKNEYDPENSSWHSLMGRPPKPVGATWLELEISKSFPDGLEKVEGGQLPMFKVIPHARRLK